MASKVQGTFIVFEGGEGTGKSTQIRQTEANLKARGFEVVVTWEPGGTALGERIRSILLDPNSGPMDPRCEALLYSAARAEHVAKVIRPALEKGAVVLCDRYWDASRAYQGAGRGLGLKPIDDLNIWATGGLFPDRVYLFDIDPEAGMERVKARTATGALDRLEQESMSFHEKIRQAYLFVARSDPARYRLIDSRKAIADIQNQISTDLLGLLAQKA
ncbi:MAG: dTMP kinase [Bdellovibrionales bacterium]|nr:dTMP kinase [Bdellovibrionales bacterium]